MRTRRLASRSLEASRRRSYGPAEQPRFLRPKVEPVLHVSLTSNVEPSFVVLSLEIAKSDTAP